MGGAEDEAKKDEMCRTSGAPLPHHSIRTNAESGSLYLSGLMSADRHLKCSCYNAFARASSGPMMHRVTP